MFLRYIVREKRGRVDGCDTSLFKSYADFVNGIPVPMFLRYIVREKRGRVDGCDTSLFKSYADFVNGIPDFFRAMANCLEH
jgi:hypothetical protein